MEAERQQPFHFAWRGRTESDEADPPLGQMLLVQHLAPPWRRRTPMRMSVTHGANPRRALSRRARYAAGGEGQHGRARRQRKNHDRIEEIVDQVALEPFPALEAADQDGVDAAALA